MMRISGKAVFVDLEGGFYGIVTDDDQQYFPVNMPQQYKADGCLVKCIVEEIPDAASLAMWGTPVRITSFQT